MPIEISRDDIIKTGKEFGIVTHVDRDGVIHLDEKALMIFHELYSAIFGRLDSIPSVLLNYQDFEGVGLESGDSLEVQFKIEVKKDTD